MTLQGLEVLLFQPDFASPPKIVGNQKVSQAALSEARRINAYTGDHPLHAFSHRFKFTSRTDAAIVEDFIFDRAGRWQPFWIPSWHGELNPVATIADGSSQLSITPVNYATVFDPTHTNFARLGHYIFLIHFDGTFLVRRVTGVSGTSPEVLTLDSPVTREFALGQFAVGFVYCVTLISDKFSLAFNGIENSSTELAFAEEAFIDDPTIADSTPDLNDILVADFEMDVDAGDPPLDVAFTDTSRGTPVSWLWNFGDGTATSTTQNPTHEFTNSGTFNVKLTVKDASGATSVITKTVLVNAEPVTPAESLTAEFSFDPTTGDAALAVDFTDESLGTPTVWTWDFGDGSYGYEQNPSHTYAMPGVYTITLDVRDTNGATSRKVDSITVTEAGPVAATCDSGAEWTQGMTTTSCSVVCSALSAMGIGDLEIYNEIPLIECLGIDPATTPVFTCGGFTFSCVPDAAYNAGIPPGDPLYYDITRTA